mgnify:CR=1 FL=1
MIVLFFNKKINIFSHKTFEEKSIFTLGEHWDISGNTI